MPVVLKIDKETPLPGGEKLIRGSFTMDSSYAASGEVMNLANYLDSTGYPTVVCGQASGYVLNHNQGTAAAGTILAYQNVLNTDTMNGVAANSALYQVHTGKDLSAVNCTFFAIGKAF